MGFFDAIGSVVSGITGGSLLGAGASIASGLIGAESAADTNAASLNAQRELRDTQYQSAVEDMKKAGLNPMLATKLGGNMASSVPQLTPPASAGIQSALNSAQVAKTYADAKASEATANNQQANADVTKALGMLEVESKINNANTQADVNRKTLDIMDVQIPKIIAETRVSAGLEHKVYQEAANAIAEGRRINANTGNLEADTALKRIQSVYWDVQSRLGSQGINFNILDTARRQRESDMYTGPAGAVIPYLNSAGKAVDTFGKGVQLFAK